MPPEIDEPECLQRQRVTLSRTVDALVDADATTQTPAATEPSAADAPDPEATKVVTPATIHPTVNGAATAGRQDWANSIAVN
jgi:hypothetical protein